MDFLNKNSRSKHSFLGSSSVFCAVPARLASPFQKARHPAPFPPRIVPVQTDRSGLCPRHGSAPEDTASTDSEGGHNEWAFLLRINTSSLPDQAVSSCSRSRSA